MRGVPRRTTALMLGAALATAGVVGCGDDDESDSSGGSGGEASKPASFRQKWEKEPFGTIGFRFRNLSTNACLIAPATAMLSPWPAERPASTA